MSVEDRVEWQHGFTMNGEFEWVEKVDHEAGGVR